jgi:prepilin-type N-terminal cleavage/methylation domain-containing protein
MLVTILPRQKGFSLVELMISLTLGLVVMGGALSIVTSILATNTSTLKMTRLDQELRAVMMMLTRDLRRAGSWGLAAEVVESSFDSELTLSAALGSSVTITSSLNTFDLDTDDPGTKIMGQTLKYVGTDGDIGLAIITGYTSASEVTVDITDSFPSITIPAGTWTILNPFSEIVVIDDLNGDSDANDSCILFTYDASYDIDNDGDLDPPNGYLDTEKPNERYGFRLDTTEKAIEVRQAGAGCADAGWQNLTDENSIEITALEIKDLWPSSISSAGYSVVLRQFSITLTGRLKDDPAVERTLRETIKVRNNQVL